jgi:site-specific DNA recombinase
VLYGRVSTREQVQEGNGIEAQFAKCRAWALSRGLEIVGEETDPGVSGGEGIKRRPGLARALALVEGKEDTCIVAYSLSRLSRSMSLTGRLLLDDKAPLRFASVSEPFDSTTSTGRMMLGIVASFAQYEREIAGERTKAGLDHLRAMGRTLGPKPLEQIDLTVLPLVLELRALNHSHARIAEQLTARGIPTRRGKAWNRTTVRRMLARKSTADVSDVE